jgi:hypothetical protein
MKYLCVVAGLSLLTASAVAQQRPRVIGLLALPEVFGNGACDRFTPQEVALYGAPESARVVGVIRVDVGSTAPSNGGCEGLRVGVHMTGTPASDPLPTKEYGYEDPGAIVLARRVITSPCGEDPNVKALDRGWVPAHTKSGEPVIWFYSRGC